MRQDVGAGLVEVRVVVGVIEVPVRVDEKGERPRPHRVNRGLELRPRRLHEAVGDELAVRACLDDHVAARPGEHGDSRHERRDRDRNRPHLGADRRQRIGWRRRLWLRCLCQQLRHTAARGGTTGQHGTPTQQLATRQDLGHLRLRVSNSVEGQ